MPSPESNPGDAPPPRSRLARIAATVWPLFAGALFGVAARLLFAGQPGGAYAPMMSSFVLLVPAGVGAITTLLTEGRDLRRARYFFGRGALANVLFLGGTFAILVEGLICIIIAAPLFAVIGGSAAVLTGFVCRRVSRPERTVYAIAALPLLLGGIEQYVPIPQTTSTAERTRIINAGAEAIWANLLSARDIQPEEINSAWMYRIGVPVPISAVAEEREGVQVRHISMGKGIHFDQVAADWIPRKRVRWLYRFSDDSFPAGALDDHVRIGGAYFDVLDTDYSLDRVGDATRLTVRMTYRVSTSFNWYAKPLAAFLVGNFEDAALGFYARRSELASPRPP